MAADEGGDFLDFENMSQSDLEEVFRRVVQDDWANLKSEIEKSMATGEQPVLDLDELGRRDSALVDFIVEKPDDAISALEKAIREYTENDERECADLKITGSEASMPSVRISDMRTEHFNRLMLFYGTVSEATDVFPRPSVIAWQCMVCGAEIRTVVETNKYTKVEPFECYESQGGCGKKTVAFKEVPEDTIYTDTQYFLLQDPAHVEAATDCRCFAFEENAGQVTAGDEIKIVGHVQIRSPEKKIDKTDWFVRVYGVEHEEEKETFEMSESELERARELASGERRISRMAASIAPSIFGRYTIKKALLLQAFSGVRREKPDGTSVRGKMHIMLVGDPSTAKSQLANIARKLHPRSKKVEGRNVTHAGLLGSAVRSQLNDTWKIKSGAFTMANEGLLVIDEWDKVADDVKGGCHTPMSEGYVDIVKAGQSATLPTRTSVLAMKNPKDKRWDRAEMRSAGGEDYMFNQIELQQDMWSRFDIIIPVVDLRDETLDRNISLSATGFIDDSFEFSTSFLRKYIYMSREADPVMTEDVAAAIADYYSRSRAAKDSDSIKVQRMSPRDNETLIRLTEAVARTRLAGIVTDEGVTMQDFEVAKQVFEDVHRHLSPAMWTKSFDDMDEMEAVDIESYQEACEKMQFLARTLREHYLPCSKDTVLQFLNEEHTYERLKNEGYIVENDGRVYPA